MEKEGRKEEHVLALHRMAVWHVAERLQAVLDGALPIEVGVPNQQGYDLCIGMQTVSVIAARPRVHRMLTRAHGKGLTYPYWVHAWNIHRHGQAGVRDNDWMVMVGVDHDRNVVRVLCVPGGKMRKSMTVCIGLHRKRNPRSRWAEYEDAWDLMVGKLLVGMEVGERVRRTADKGAKG